MHTEEIRKVPFLRALIPLLAGIIASRYLSCQGILPWLLCILLFILLCMGFYFSHHNINPYFNRLYGVVLQLLFIALGMVYGQGNESYRDIPYTSYTARICGDILDRESSSSLVLDRIYYCSGKMRIRLKGKVQVYVQKEQRTGRLKPGMCMVARGGLNGWERSPDRKNFDYGAYLAGRGIYYTGYLDSLSWMLIPGRESMDPRILALNLRRSMMGLLLRERPPGFNEEGAILASLLAGYRGGLGDDLKQQFIRSGSMHILAISGLHVGILYLIPALIIRHIRRHFLLRVIASVLSLLLLWGYALLTGMSPSVSRAAGMCSLHAVARLTGRKASLLHLLSLAALIMILLRPPLIFEAGFQLSFSAVTGIALFHRRLANLVTFPGRLLRWCWKMSSLSLSAQIGTAPLVIYHFHGYPNYSLLSNFLVVPLAALILYNGILFFSLSWIPVLSGFLSLSLHYLGRILNTVTGIAGQLPGAFSGELSISLIEVILIYILIFFIYLFIHYRDTRIIMAVLLSMVLLLSVSSCLKYRELRRPVSFTGPYIFLYNTDDQLFNRELTGHVT